MARFGDGGDCDHPALAARLMTFRRAGSRRELAASAAWRTGRGYRGAAGAGQFDRRIADHAVATIRLRRCGRDPGRMGAMEEITGTTCHPIWDQRRLIVPLNVLSENPFANWTRNSSQIMALCFSMSITACRSRRYAKTRTHFAERAEWDKRVQVLQVTDATEKSCRFACSSVPSIPA